jgi:mevalonate kinase
MKSLSFSGVSAPGKIILSGEHAVVYGYPALVSAIDFRLMLDNSGKISSKIPIGCGLGSSAALAVASSALKLAMKGCRWNLEKINQMAYELEKRHHGNPSGVDNTVVTYGGFLWYRKESESLKLFRSFKPKNKLANLYIINTGKPQETTGEMVSFIRSKYQENRKKVESIFKSIEGLTRLFLDAPLPELIWENEILLEKLGVVSEKTKSLVKNIEKLGGSAKICGAGGIRTNSGVLLVFNKDREKMYNFAGKNNLDLFAVKFGEKGVKIKYK